MKPVFMFRYDTESTETENISGFLERAVEIHRKYAIPATFFCTGGAIDAREGEFRDFYLEVKDDPLFDIQDHSYSHIGLCKKDGPSLDEIRDDYKRSFDVHERVFGVRPLGVSLCGTGEAPLSGFDATEKSKKELDLMASMGVKFINTSLTGKDKKTSFCNYSSLGYPDIMGFPTSIGDCDAMLIKGDGGYYGWKSRHSEHLLDLHFAFYRFRFERREAVASLVHDWALWNLLGGKSFSTVIKIAEFAKSLGFEMITHKQAYEKAELWKK